MITKKEFLIRYNTANYLANGAFSKLGLISKRFTKCYSDIYLDLNDEEYYIKSEFAIKEGGTIKKDQQTQHPIIDSSKDKECFQKLKLWKQEELGIELDKHIVFKPTEKDYKLFMISPDIYETLNGLVFELDEETYLNIIEEK